MTNDIERRAPQRGMKWAMKSGMTRTVKRAIRHTIAYAIGTCAIACSMAGYAQDAAAQTTEVPQAWISYALVVGEQFQRSLEAYDDTANELHAFLEDRMQHAPADTVPAMITVRAWIGNDGSVTRVAFDSLGDAQADDDLRAVLMAHAIGVSPPADMRQPLRVRLVLEAKPDAQPDGGHSSGTSSGNFEQAPVASPHAVPPRAASAS
ncbi:YbaB/EbfC family DNA-binding protein [Paraburkholderia sp. SARCC-3016]|uniref:YbaB/EbfC family DNA-binding protein n=1 Tax=Paraburkholderia sp. SARCC-3016 TaxID=3058611 RepID=UPI0028084F7E|nr:YbaB/EbfC family DNA-binding protein [Paraburkholderia sp. SARCC-3016]MDQ7978498.1 YbaB/EbfC family DNA-binding protein [Paraburkholderia sp. SARCC-3016]